MAFRVVEYFRPVMCAVGLLMAFDRGNALVLYESHVI